MAPIKVWELAGADPKRVFSPFCWASRLAVLHKGLQFESVPWCASCHSGSAAAAAGCCHQAKRSRLREFWCCSYCFKHHAVYV